MSYFLNETICQKLPLTDERQRYFLDIMRTRLNVGSPLYVQSNSFNLFFITKESLNYIEKFKNDEKRYINYLKQSLRELQSICNEDIVYKELFLPIEIIKNNIESCINYDQEKKGNYNFDLLEFNLKLILSNQEKYENIAFKKLRFYLLEDEFELGKCERVFSKIRLYTKFLISQLIFKGFSNIYLYNRLAQFLKENNYKGNSFNQQFDKIIGSLITKKSKIQLYLAIKAKKDFSNIALLNEYNFNFFNESEGNEVLVQKIKHIKPQEQDIYIVEYDTQATDYLSAILSLNNKIEKISDLYIHGDNLIFYKDIVVKNGLAIQKYNIDKIWKTIFSDQWYLNEMKNSYDLKTIISIFNHESQKTLSQSLRYLKIGSNSQNIEQKFLNYWISLESLFSWHKSDSILNAMNEFIPYFSFIDNIKSRINLIKTILNKYNPTINPVIINRLKLDEGSYINLKNSDLIKILKSKDDYKKLLDDLNNLEYAKSIIIEQFEILKDTKAYFDNHKRICENNLRRIYSYRNQIAHQGHYDKIPVHLILMSKSYIFSCYYSLIYFNLAIRADKNININGNLEMCKTIIKGNIDINIYDLFD
ncbi:hypothetical protein HNP31_000926 [Acinetobacter johnsonii]|uniref:hypothetical protein n=1 Tax=Acinetobacter johnsonii TaxID=40214 RepID=UPI00160F1619|nr:hypothetical protein [Acinetobacter johnsonii]MBB4809233.1 hypothetical protein [Acinetobacter johnsonii]